MAKGQMIVALDFSGIAEDEFHDWFDTEHMPERERVVGFLSCQRWIGVQNPKEAVHLFDLDNLAVLESPAYRAISGNNVSIWSKRIRAKCRRLIRFEGMQILPGDALAPEGAGGLLVVGMTPPVAAETQFNAWYDIEHMPALARVPGVLCARRFRAAGSGPKYIALYHLSAPGVIDGAQWKEASESTPMPAHIRPQITDCLRFVCRPYGRRATGVADSKHPPLAVVRNS
jgi:hypothetical protein